MVNAFTLHEWISAWVDHWRNAPVRNPADEELRTASMAAQTGQYEKVDPYDTGEPWGSDFLG